MYSFPRHIVLAVVMSFSCVYATCQTYYYQLSSVKEHGAKSPGDNSGIFVTFTSKGCYVSDSKGISDNSGFMRYENQNGQVMSYKGKSHYGDCNFYVAKDLNLLNVVYDNVTLVYKKAASQGASKSTYYSGHIHKHEGHDAVAPQQGTITPQHNMEMSNPFKREWVKCVSCGGSGKCTSCAGRGYDIVNSFEGTSLFKCGVCYGTGVCRVCRGQGGYKL